MLADQQESELERFKRAINLTEYAASIGYELDAKESSRSAVIMRRGKGVDKVVIRRDQDGHFTYFNVHDDNDNGTIIDFIQQRDGCSLGFVRKTLRQWLGEDKPVVEITSYQPKIDRSVADREAVAASLSNCRAPNSWGYLLNRGLSLETLSSERFSGRILQDSRNNMIFPHSDQSGVCGYEIKNRGFTGFASGGLKSVWHSLTKQDDHRLVFCEVAIDALSYFQLHDDGKTRYMSFAGSMNDYQREVVIPNAILKMPSGSVIVSAFDNDDAGEKFAQLVEPHVTSAYSHERSLPPVGLDWNDVVQGVTK